MRLKLVERKTYSLNESDEVSNLEVSMSPLSYIKLTTGYDDFNAIVNFIQEKKHEQAVEIPSFKARKSFIEKKLGGSKTDQAVDLLIRVTNFMKPTEDSPAWGAFNEEKSGTASMAVEVTGDVGKVKNHEGRNRSLYRYIKGETAINVSISFYGATVNTVGQMPRTLISQFDEKSKVFRGDIAPAVEKDKSKFRTVEGFLQSLGPFPKQTLIDDLKQKSIKVAGEEVALIKAVLVSKRPDGTYSTSIFKTGLYDKKVLNIPKTDSGEYWAEVDNYKISPEKGPVTIS